jgi:hypothetical protein
VLETTNSDVNPSCVILRKNAPGAVEIPSFSGLTEGMRFRMTTENVEHESIHPYTDCGVGRYNLWGLSNKIESNPIHLKNKSLIEPDDG